MALGRKGAISLTTDPLCRITGSIGVLSNTVVGHVGNISCSK